MATESEILQVSEHALALDEIVILDRETEAPNSTMSVKPSKILGTLYPFIDINNYEFAQADIISAELSTNGFLPTIRLKLMDGDGLFQSRQFALDGAIINYYIRANNEDLFKPIHINFDITSIVPGGKSGDIQTFLVTGQMKVPNLYTEYCEAYPELSSYEVLAALADKLSLGFATNETETTDLMTWINAYDSTLKFIQDVTANVYKDEESFYTTFIDPYYNLTFVNINKVYNNMDLVPSEIYSITPQDMVVDDHEYDVIPLVFSNHQQFKGQSKYINTYKFGNNTASVFLKNGYKRGVQYYDSIENAYISDLVVDPLTGDNEENIHLKGRIVDGSPEGLVDEYIKYKFFGKQNENVHDYYMYSNAFNYQNLQESKKMYMVIEIRGTDMSIYKYQSVLVQIFEYSNEYRSVAIDRAESPDEIDLNESKGIYNEFLSGMYVITGIDYIFKTPGPMYQRIYLSKRDFTAPI